MGMIWVKQATGGAAGAESREIGFRRYAAAIAVAVACAWTVFPSAADASQTHRFKETFGSSAKPSFAEPAALAVAPAGAPDQGDLYVADVGVDEVQSVTLEGGPTGGSFKLAFEGCETAPLSVGGASSPSAAVVQAALEGLTCIHGANVSVGGPSGALPDPVTYTVIFVRQLATTDVPQMTCDGSGLSGGSSPSCAVTTMTEGISSKIERFKPGGAPDEFSALGSNVIEGLVITFPELVQIAIAPPGSSGGTEGDIYITQVESGSTFVFAPTGAFLGQLTEFKEGPSASGANSPLVQPCGVSVDANGTLYVSDAATGVHKYLPSSNPVTVAQNTANFTSVESPCNIAVGAGESIGSIFVDHAFEGLFKVNALSGAVSYEIRPGDEKALAADPVSGHVFVAEGSEVMEFDASGVEPKLASPPFLAPSSIRGMAVDAAGNVYLSLVGDPNVEIYGPATVIDVKEENATDVGKTTAKLEGVIDTESTAATQCVFEYGKTIAYGESAPCSDVDGTPISGPGEIPADDNDHTVSAQLSGLEENTPYHFRLRVANAVSPTEGKDQSLETLGPPRISGDAVSGITSTAARMGGVIDPRGEATTFFVEYVTGAEFEASGYAGAAVVPATPQALGSGVGGVGVSQEIVGLAPGTVYHARLVAKNQSEPAVHGKDILFATFLEAGALPDGRVYEMVTPPAKSGEVFPPESKGFLGGSCSACLPGSERAKMPMQAAPGGNSLAYEGQPFFPGLGSEANEYLGRRDPLTGWATEGLSRPQYRTNTPSPELQRAGFVGFSADLSRGAIFQVEPTLSPEAPEGYADLYLWQHGSESLQPLITAKPPHRPAGGPSPPRFLPIYGGANAGTGSVEPFTRMIFEANDSLTAAVSGVAPKAPDVEPTEHDVYEWSGGQLALVSVLPGNSKAAPDAVIGSGHLVEEDLQAEGPVFEGAISADGSRIYWTNLADQRLYVRINATETRQIPDVGKFLTASADGNKVLLSDGHIYDLEAKQNTDLTVGKGGFLGTLGGSADLSRVYFVDSQVLTPESAKNPNGEHAEVGADNLYAWREGVRTFIGKLLPVDNKAFGTQQSMGAWKPSPSQRTAQVSPDGRYLAFTSSASLTGYDNARRGGGACGSSRAGAACWQVFLYDAQGGKLTCASCNPSGIRPLGYSNLSLIENINGAAFLPAPRNLTANGRLFFESQDPLSSADTNGNIQDVYEWEPAGVGTCAREAGCLALISSGSSANDSQFLAASESGDDAFFTTRQQLLPQDKDDYLDVYDARVGGVVFSEEGSPPCGGEECRGPASAPPAEVAPGSASFDGPGNQPVKKKHKKHKHRKHKKHHHKHKHARGASR